MAPLVLLVAAVQRDGAITETRFQRNVTKQKQINPEDRKQESSREHWTFHFCNESAWVLIWHFTGTTQGAKPG